jgi:hypothetical protein
MIKIKKDIPIVEEFFGCTDDVISLVTPSKSCRLYSKEGSIVVVLTPMLDDGETFNELKEIVEEYESHHNIKYSYRKVKRGKNSVIILDRIG